MALLAKRVRASWTSSTWTSISSAPSLRTFRTSSMTVAVTRPRERGRHTSTQQRVVRARVLRTGLMVRKPGPDLYISKPRRRRSVAGPHSLHRLPLAAIRSAPQSPLVSSAKSHRTNSRTPSYPTVAGFFNIRTFFPPPNPPANFRRRLKLYRRRPWTTNFVSIKIPSSVSAIGSPTATCPAANSCWSCE